jgi:hypothetical protein
MPDYDRKITPSHIPRYLRDARPTACDVRREGMAAVQTRRVKAIKALHYLFRQWKADVAQVCDKKLPWPKEVEALRLLQQHWIATLGAPPDFDLALRDFFHRLGHVIFASPDPLAIMTALWTDKSKRGAPRRNTTRDFNLAIDIQELVNTGRTVDAACGDVFERLDLTSEELDVGTLRNIYFAQTRGESNKRRIKGMAALRALLEQERDSPSE